MKICLKQHKSCLRRNVQVGGHKAFRRLDRKIILCLIDGAIFAGHFHHQHFFKLKISGYFVFICFNSTCYIAYVSSATVSELITID